VRIEWFAYVRGPPSSEALSIAISEVYIRPTFQVIQPYRGGRQRGDASGALHYFQVMQPYRGGREGRDTIRAQH